MILVLYQIIKGSFFPNQKLPSFVELCRSGYVSGLFDTGYYIRHLIYLCTVREYLNIQNARMYKSLRFKERTIFLLALMGSSVVFLSCQSLDGFVTIYYGTNFAVNILIGTALYSVSKSLFADV